MSERPSDQPEQQLLPRAAGHVTGGDDASGVHPAAKEVERRAVQQRVVQVEERSGPRRPCQHHPPSIPAGNRPPPPPVAAARAIALDHVVACGYASDGDGCLPPGRFVRCPVRPARVDPASIDVDVERNVLTVRAGRKPRRVRTSSCWPAGWAASRCPRGGGGRLSPAGPAWVAGLLDPVGCLLLVAVVLAVDVDVVDGNVDFGDL